MCDKITVPGGKGWGRGGTPHAHPPPVRARSCTLVCPGHARGGTAEAALGGPALLGRLLSHLGARGGIWGHLGAFGATRGHLGPPGGTRGHLGTLGPAAHMASCLGLSPMAKDGLAGMRRRRRKGGRKVSANAGSLPALLGFPLAIKTRHSPEKTCYPTKKSTLPKNLSIPQKNHLHPYIHLSPNPSPSPKIPYPFPQKSIFPSKTHQHPPTHLHSPKPISFPKKPIISPTNLPPGNHSTNFTPQQKKVLPSKNHLPQKCPDRPPSPSPFGIN